MATSAAVAGSRSPGTGITLAGTTRGPGLLLAASIAAWCVAKSEVCASTMSIGAITALGTLALSRAASRCEIVAGFSDMLVSLSSSRSFALEFGSDAAELRSQRETTTFWADTPFF